MSVPLDDNHFTVKLSGEKEWIIPDTANDTSLSGTSLTITRTLSEDQDPVVAYNKENLILPYDTQWPVAQVILNAKKQHNPFIYRELKSIKPTKVEITVDVEGVKDLVLQSDEGPLDPSKPLLPFGSRPYIGSNFYIGSWEAFQKKLDTLSFNFKWNDLPDSTFSDYYSGYEAVNSRINSAFKIDIKCLDKKEWVDLDNESALFTDEDGNGISDSTDLPGPDDITMIEISNTSSLIDILRTEKLEKFDAFDHEKPKGFVRFTLKGKNFGHKEFPNIYAEAAIDMANEGAGASLEASEGGVSLRDTVVVDAFVSEHPSISRQDALEFLESFGIGTASKLPNAPYTPSIQDLSANYTSSVEINLEQVYSNDYKKRVEKFFLTDAFGVKEADTQNFDNYLLPQFENEANLYIGINNLVPPQTVSILFQVAEGSANPDEETQKVLWHYLDDNEWVEFENTEVLSDSTNGLLTSGIVSLAVPKEATNDNTLLETGCHWIRVSVHEDSDAICKLIDVQCQAVLAKFEDNGNDPDHLRSALAADTISKLLKSDNSIKEVSQPYASFNGKVAEQSADFYMRVSERLRHKQRAITIWDYERIILQNFPSVYKVKCANHTCFEGTLLNYSEIAPGHATLIVVSNVQNKNAVDPLRPKTSLSTLDEISDYIKELNPMGATIHVKNPIYEEVRVKFNVKFTKDDLGYYQTKLEQEIKDFLSPWVSACASDIVFGGRIHRSMILNFVEERAYVDYVTCFEMNHIVPLDPSNNPTKDVEEAVATTAISILGSADKHFVTPIPADEGCMCDDNEIIKTKKFSSKDECPCDSSKGI